MSNAGSLSANLELLIHTLVSSYQRMNRAVTLRMRCELQVVLQREAYRTIERFRLDVPHTSVVRIGDRINLPDPPRLAHEGTAGKHAAIHVRFQPPQPKPGIVLV